MRKKSVVVGILLLIILVFCISNRYFFKTTKEKFDSVVLEDDVKFALHDPKVPSYTVAYQYDLEANYILTVKIELNKNLIYEANLGKFTGKGKYYFRVSNDGKNLNYYDFDLRNVKSSVLNSSSSDEVVFEADVKGMPQTDVFKLDKDKRDNVICEMSWTNRLSNSKDLLVLTLHLQKK